MRGASHRAKLGHALREDACLRVASAWHVVYVPVRFYLPGTTSGRDTNNLYFDCQWSGWRIADMTKPTCETQAG